MLPLRVTVSMFSLWVILLAESVTFSHQDKIHRNLGFHPVYRATGFDGEDCLTEPCLGRNPLRRTLVPQMANLPEINFNDDFNDLWINSLEDGDFTKRSRQDISGRGHDSQMIVGGVSYPHSYSSIYRTGAFEDTKPSCACIVEKETKDLGTLRYPRYLTIAKCINTPCDRQVYCKEITFKISVLKQKEDGEEPDRHAQLLPGPLRENYVFETVVITVGCECSL